MRSAGLYLRISKDLHDGAGVDRQREDGTRLVEQRGWKLHHVYVDNDISANGRRKRPDYQRLLADLESGTIDAVASRSFERLCKTRREQLTFVELGQEKRCPVAFTHAPDLDLTTAVGRGIADMMAAWARVEMEQKSERHIDQIAQAARRGLIVGAPRPFGYLEGGMHLHPDEAPVLAAMYDRFLTGESLGSLARWLNDRGMLSPRGNRWRHQSVREVLANPRNGGIRGMRPVVNRRTGSRSQWHVEVGPAAWPPVVPEATWRATMAVIRDPLRPGNHEGYNQQKYLLTGIAVCGVCGRPMVTGGCKADMSRTGAGTLRYRVLRCPDHHISRRADYIDAWVQEQVIGYFIGPGRQTLPRAGGPDVDLEAVRSESVQIRTQLRGLAADYGDGVLDREQVRVAGDRLRARLVALDELVTKAGAVDVTAPLRAAEDAEQVWDGMTIPEKRAVLRDVATVRVLPGSPGRPGGKRFHGDSVQVSFRQA